MSRLFFYSLHPAILNPHLIPKAVISSFSSSIALHPRLYNWKDAPLSFDIVDLIEGTTPVQRPEEILTDG
ncbi:unnamed protein product, partial [Vitis vinifera]|uniref:Uncharacterized protein n=1 Tax=Vitis vinifera TaxID=29760 RepID=D7SJZ0_VITVI